MITHDEAVTVMHSSELKNRALVAASIAQADGFHATAEAFLLLVRDCIAEATENDRESAVRLIASRILEAPHR